MIANVVWVLISNQVNFQRSLSTLERVNFHIND